MQFFFFAAPIFSAVIGVGASSDYFQIKVVDDQTGRGVPLVKLRTVNDICYYTDSAGVVAFHEPSLMDKTVFFHISSHGYEYPKDGFGIRGARLEVAAGEKAVLKIKRLNIAERLYRVTGGGVYRDSVLVGEKPPIEEPLINGLVLGSDSVVNAVYRGKIYWFWGDTNRPSYPLGNFHVPGATSQLSEKGGLDPEVGVNLHYFLDQDGFAKPTAKMPGSGPTWIDSLIVIPNEKQSERLFAKFVKIKPPLKVYQRGLAEFNDETKEFKKVLEFDNDAPFYPEGHPFLYAPGDEKDPSSDGEYIYFANPFPFLRVPASAAALRDLSQYEAYTCVLGKGRDGSATLNRDEHGKLVFDWKKNVSPWTQEKENKLARNGQIKPGEGIVQVKDVETGKQVLLHRGSVYWNEYRKKWIMIAVQSMGTSMLGEVWFSEASAPTGPWRLARKIVTHDKYSFYNPKQHPMFDKEGGRIIFFEGTYVNTFSGNPDATPRYNYNQVMYRLDLADPRLALSKSENADAR